MVEIPLGKLVKLDCKNAQQLWPKDFAAFIQGIHNELTGKSELPDKVKETLEALGELPPETAAEKSPDQHPLPGLFDRTTLVAMGEWAKDNDEPWLERACKFLIRHQDVRIVIEKRSYGSYWQFDRESMPKAWRGISYYGTVAELLFALADEIEERLTGLDLD